MNAKEFQYNDVVINGFVALFVNLAILPLLIVMSFILFKGSIVLFLLLILFLAAAILMIPGYFSQEPNEARAMVFFGKYKGTFTETGFFWVNPFMNKKKLSLRARNLDIEPIKVNDKIGNPILIGLVLVWKLKDTYKAMFEIDAQTMADNKGTGQMMRNRCRTNEMLLKILCVCRVTLLSVRWQDCMLTMITKRIRMN